MKIGTPKEVFDGENRVAHPSVPKPFWDIGSVDGSWGALEDIPYADDGNPQSGWIYGDWSKVKPMKPGDPTPDERNAAWAAERISAFSKQMVAFLFASLVEPNFRNLTTRFNSHTANNVCLAYYCWISRGGKVFETRNYSETLLNEKRTANHPIKWSERFAPF